MGGNWEVGQKSLRPALFMYILDWRLSNTNKQTAIGALCTHSLSWPPDQLTKLQHHVLRKLDENPTQLVQ